MNAMYRGTLAETLLIASARGHTLHVHKLLLEGAPLHTNQVHIVTYLSYIQQSVGPITHSLVTYLSYLQQSSTISSGPCHIPGQRSLLVRVTFLVILIILIILIETHQIH